MRTVFSQMPIHLRLNAVIATLLLLSLAGLVLALLIEARPRVSDENASMMAFTEAHLRATRSVVLASPEPVERLRELVSDLNRLRHIKVSLLSPGDDHPSTEHMTVEYDWLTQLMFGSSERELVKVRFDRDGKQYGTVVLEANPVDELDEVRSAIDDIVKAGLLLAVAVFSITSWMTWRALNPIRELCIALGVMESGNFDVDLKVTGAPEIRAISRSVTSLAAALRKAQQENSRLATQLIHLQDDERRAIARELHDESGPHLYSARARATALQIMLEKSPIDPELAKEKVGSLQSEIAALQLVNRRVLQQLSPAGFGELGLEGALRNLGKRWREEHPDIPLDVVINVDGIALDETAALTVYRVVQEALTNAYRHSKAASITVMIDTVAPEDNAAIACATPLVRIRVVDDGNGLSGNMTFGYGLRGMRERVAALGGKLSVSTRPTRGVELIAHVPPRNDRSRNDRSRNEE